MSQNKKFLAALALIQAQETARLQKTTTTTPVVVETRPQTLSDYDETLSLSLNSVTTQSLEYRSGVDGWLVGVTIFTDAVDLNDRMRVTLNGRDLKQNIRPRANFSIEESFNEIISMGDHVILYYQSTGTTVKTIDFTPRVRYPRLGA